jgi:nucleoside-diphosphate-sugar epimerase
MKALVTGGGGFLGRRITEMLLAQGWQVRVFGRHRYPELEALGAEGCQGDLLDYQAVLQACAGIDAVFHVAAATELWGRPEFFHGINVRGTTHVVEACITANVPRLVYTGTPSVAIGPGGVEGGDESLPPPHRYYADYPASKAAAERYVLTSSGRSLWTGGSLYACSLRPHLIWGPGDTHLIPAVLAAARQGRLKMVGDGRNRVDLTYVDNAAAAHLQALAALGPDGKANGKAYFIGDAEPVELWGWINELLRRLEMPPLKKRTSLRAAWCKGAICEALWTVGRFSGQPPMTRFLAMQLGEPHWFSHRRAEADFGYRPLVGNEEGLQRLVEWLKEKN